MTRSYKKFCGPQIISTAFTTLCGLLDGINSDKEVNSIEVNHLSQWFVANIALKSKKPFHEIFNKFSEIIADEVISFEEIEDLKWVCNKFKDGGSYYNEVTKDIQFLHGFIGGMAADDMLNEKELQALKYWLVDKEYLEGTWPYDELYSLALAILADGKIDEAERKVAVSFFKDFLGINTLNTEASENQTLKGICKIDPSVQFEYKRFVITGASTKASREEIKRMIEDCAGQVDDRVTQKTDYLIVMAEGNSTWTYSVYGRKVEQAMKLRKQGHGITIVHENDLWDALRDADVA